MEKNLNQYSMALGKIAVVSMNQSRNNENINYNSTDKTDNLKDEPAYKPLDEPADKPINTIPAIFVVLYIIVWVMLTYLFYKIGTNYFYRMTGTNKMMFILLQITALIIFLLCIFYNPWNEGLKKTIDDAKKKMDEAKKKLELKPSPEPEPVSKTEKTYVSKPKKWTNTAKTNNILIRDTDKLFTDGPWEDRLKNYDTVIKDTETLPTKEPSIDEWKKSVSNYNQPEKIHQEQMKNIWKDALNKQNRYFLLGFMVLSLLPFFYFLIYIQYHTVPEINTFIQQPFSFLLLTISVFYTAILLLFYTITKKSLTTIIPLLLFLFLGGLLYFQKFLPFLPTLGVLVICIIESFLIFYNVAFAWCLIPLVPLYLILFILYTQQHRQLKS